MSKREWRDIPYEIPDGLTFGELRSVIAGFGYRVVMVPQAPIVKPGFAGEQR